MEPIRWNRIEELFTASVLLSGEERIEFLRTACAGDDELLGEVNSLLREHDRPANLLEEPVFALASRVLAHTTPHALVGKSLAGYTIVRPISSGGMGEVFLAREDRLGRDVAIKLLPTSIFQNQELVRRFRYEARAASAVSHPNVAHVYGMGESEGLSFIAMEFVDGRTLREMLASQSVPLNEAFEIVSQVAAAIAAAHARGIVHRDIKPENIIIRRDGLVKVVDFGLAKLTSESSSSQTIEKGESLTKLNCTEPGLLMGTMKYMSPEQVRGQEIDSRTDIWSWGVICYEILTGSQPFAGATKSDVIAEVLKSEPLLLRDDNHNLPQPLKSFLRKALSKDKARRYATIAEALDELGKVRRGLSMNDLDPDGGLVFDSGRADKSVTDAELSTEPMSNAVTLQMDRQKSLRRRPSATQIVIGSLVTALTLLLGYAGYRWLNRERARPAPPGAQIVRLTNNGEVLDAAISPDGRLLAYVLVKSGKQSLWIRNLESGQESQLWPPDSALCWGPRFTPNGLTLFYVTTQPGSTISVLYRMPVSGGPAQKIVTNIDSPPALSPDGMQIAFLRGYPGQHRDALMIANVDGSAEQEIASRRHPDKFDFSGMSWSPGGKQIAVGASSGNDSLFAILAVDISNGAATELTQRRWTAVRGIAWENLGLGLIFSARAEGRPAAGVWRLSIADQRLQPITNDESDYGEITLAQHDRILATINKVEFSRLWINQTELAGSATNDPGDGLGGLTASRSGQIVYTVGQDERSTLWRTNLSGSEHRQITSNASLLPSASREGLIAYASTAGGGASHIWLVDSDGRNNRQLTNGDGESYPGITPAGDWVIYTSRAKERNSLWKIPTAGGDPVQLTSSGIFIRPVVSPDATRIACTYRTDEADKWKIAILSFDSGQLLTTFALPYPYNQIIRWTPDGKAITYLNNQNGVQNVWRQPLDGSPQTAVTNFTEGLIFYYTWMPPGNQLVLSRGGVKRDAILIKDF